jgi:hypothetical protein
MFVVRAEVEELHGVPRSGPNMRLPDSPSCPKFQLRSSPGRLPRGSPRPVTRATLHPCAWRRDTRARRWLPPDQGPKNRLCTSSKAGPESATQPEATALDPASAKTVPTGSLKPDSAITAWAHLGSQADVVEERYQDGRGPLR